jgi:hypothetical protein
MRTLAMVSIIFAGALTACSGSSQSSAAPSPSLAPEPSPAAEAQAWLLVDNRSTVDLSIWVERRPQRERLGRSGALSTVRLRIPAAYVGGNVLVRFITDPVGRQPPFATGEIRISPGDTVEMVIPGR